jgi:hypothetical protein
LTRGRILFYNSVNNPELICNIEIKDLIEFTIEDVLIECYTTKTGKMFPKIIDFEVNPLQGEEIPMEKLPDEFPLLWKKFINIPE